MLMVYLVYRKFFALLWQKLNTIGRIFNVVNSQILNSYQPSGHSDVDAKTYQIRSLRNFWLQKRYVVT